MNMDILAILMVAFGLFAILLFILFYIYARTARNKKRENDDYEEDIEKYNNIDKDSDNLVDEDIEKDDIQKLNLETDNVDDFKDDGSLRGVRVISEPPVQEVEDKEVDEFIPIKKK